MDVRWICGSEVEAHGPDAVAGLLQRDDGFLWVDIPDCDTEALDLMSGVFHLHPHAVRDCTEKRHIPKIHSYADHVLLILHGIEFEQDGRSHLVELDQILGDRYLITVHGPVNPVVPREAILRETSQILRRIEARRFQPKTAAELGHGIVSTLVLRLESQVSGIADRVAKLERLVVAREKRNPQELIEELYGLRHELLTIETTANLSREVYAGRASVARVSASPERVRIVEDLMDQYERLGSLCEAEKAFVDQVLDFYQARTVTKMNIAMQRLALIATVLLPVTAISGIYGMNVIVNGETKYLQLTLILGVMGVIVFVMLRWARRQGWW